MPSINAYDLKSKVQNLISCATETSQHLSSIIDRINEVGRDVISRENKVRSLTSEKDSLERAVVDLKKRMEGEYAAHTGRMAQEKSSIEALKAATTRERDQAAILLNSVKSKEIELSANIEQFESKRRAMEVKAEKLRELIS